MTGLTNPSQTSQSSSTSYSLLRRVKRNDADAWQRLIDLYTPLVCYWCRRANLSQDDTEEVSQETFRAVHASIGNFSHQRPSDTFRGWLRTIVRSKIASLFEKKNKAPAAPGGTEALRWLEQLPDVPDEDETGVVNSLYQRAMQLIEDKFEPNTWQAFLFVVIDGLDAEAAGERLGMSAGAVRNARYKVLRELRMQLGDVE